VKEYTPSAAAITPDVSPSAAPQVSLPPPTEHESYTDYPFLASSLASHLTLSKSSIPHYYLTMDINLDSLLSLRSKLPSDISLFDLLIKASGCAMKTVPSANASWVSDEFIRMYHDVHVNVLLRPEQGGELKMALVRDVDKSGVSSISKEIQTAMETLSSEQQLPPHLSGIGTFTILNLGMYGISSGAAIIPPPQSCILTLGAAQNRILPSLDEEVPYRQSVVMTVTLSCDHRVVDGAVGAQWLGAFKQCVESPETLLL